MKTPREFCQVCMASAILGWPQSAGAQSDFDSRTIYRLDLPLVNLTGWKVTFLELNFPAGSTVPSHRHPGFVLGCVLEGKYRLHVEGAPELVLSAGDVF
jgi:quercetin dioxygenase-like cupin family protein